MTQEERLARLEEKVDHLIAELAPIYRCPALVLENGTIICEGGERLQRHAPEWEKDPDYLYHPLPKESWFEETYEGLGLQTVRNHNVWKSRADTSGGADGRAQSPQARPAAAAQPQPASDDTPSGSPAERPPGIAEGALPEAYGLKSRQQLLKYAIGDLHFADKDAVLSALGLDEAQDIPIAGLHQAGERLLEIAIERQRSAAVTA